MFCSLFLVLLCFSFAETTMATPNGMNAETTVAGQQKQQLCAYI